MSVRQHPINDDPARAGWRMKYLRRLQEQRKRERAVTKDWGMSPGGKGYEGHDVPEKSFVADVKRKVALKRVMPGGDAQDMRARKSEEGLGKLRAVRKMLRAAAAAGPLSPALRKLIKKVEGLMNEGRAHVGKKPRDYDRGLGGKAMGNHIDHDPHGFGEGTGADGEISKLMKDAEQMSFAGKPVGTRKGADLYERLAEAAVRAFNESYAGSGPRSDKDVPSMDPARSGKPRLFPKLTRGKSHARDLQDRREKDARRRINTITNPKALASAKKKKLQKVERRRPSVKVHFGESDANRLVEAAFTAARATATFNEGYSGAKVDMSEPWRVDQNYRLADRQDRSCGSCKFYDGDGGCVKFDAMVRAVDVCDAWAAGKGKR